MVHDAHLFILQIHSSSFGTGQWGESGTTILSMKWHMEGSRMLQSLILINALSSAFWEEKKQQRDFFFPGLVIPCWLCGMEFLWLLDAIKS
jgi:hypothetical protein